MVKRVGNGGWVVASVEEGSGVREAVGGWISLERGWWRSVGRRVCVPPRSHSPAVVAS